MSAKILPAIDAKRPRSSPTEAGRIALQAVLPEELVQRVPGVLLPEARRITAAVHNGNDYTAPHSEVRRTSREAVCAVGYVPTLHVERTAHSSFDDFVKFAFRTHDDHVIEAVRIPLEHPRRFSVCVSSQVGCALACGFCATGRMGLARNLDVWEIIEQVRLVKSTLEPGQRVHGVVFQGMGEPLANFERVRAAIEVLRNPCGVSIDARNITVSTAGLPNGIRRLAKELPNVRLAWSIGSARTRVRTSLMPINGAHPLEETYRACVEHAQATKLSPLWALTLLAGHNDSDADATALAELVQRFRRDSGHSPRVSIIPYNAIDADDDPYRRVSEEVEQRFRRVMKEHGVVTHKRYSGGGDVAAACGQLAARA